MELTTLQRDIAEPIRAHLGVADRVRQCGIHRVNAPGTGGAKQLMLGNEVAHLW